MYGKTVRVVGNGDFGKESRNLEIPLSILLTILGPDRIFCYVF